MLDRNQHQRLNLTILTSNCFYFSKEGHGISDGSIYGRADGSSPWAGTETDPHVCAQMTGSLLTQCSALAWLDLNKMPWQCATQQCPDDKITSPPRYAINITNDILTSCFSRLFFCGQNNHKTMRASDYNVLQNLLMPWNDRIPPNCLSLWQPPVTTHSTQPNTPIHANDPLPVLIPLAPLPPQPE